MSATTAFEEPAIPYPPRFWWVKRIAALSILLIIAFALLMKWWGYEAHRRLQSEIDAIHARGEPILVEDYQTKPVADASNAALSLIAAAQQATALTGAQQNYIDSFDQNSRIDPAGMKMLEQINLNNSKTWQLARLARFQPEADWGIRMSSLVINVMLPSLSSQRALATLLNANALYEHAAGHDADAVETLRDLLRQSDAFQQHSPTLIGHLVAVAFGALACETIKQISFDLEVSREDGATTSPSSAASREQVMALIVALLDDRAYQKGLVTAMHGERTFQYDSSTTHAGRIAASGLSSSLPAIRLNLLQPMFELDALRMMEYMKGIIAASAQPNSPVARALLPDTSHLKVGIAPLTSLSRIMTLILLPSLDRAVDAHFRALAERRVAALFLAIRLYQLDHNGKLPAALSDLVPTYLTAIPIDPYSPNGEGLKYRVSPAPMIYSVGADGKDDGGDASLPPTAPKWAIAATRPAGYPYDDAKWQRRDVIYPLVKLQPPPTTNGN